LAVIAFTLDITPCLTDPGEYLLTYILYHFLINFLNLNLVIAHHRYMLVPEFLHDPVLAANYLVFSGVPDAVRPARYLWVEG
jgi:hypothetical protein